MLMTITISKVNETYIKVVCPESYQEMDIQDRFSFKEESFQYAQRSSKLKYWDGTIKLYNRKTKYLYLGLLYELLEFISLREWDYELDPALLPDEDTISKEEILDIINEVIQPCDNGKPLTLYDYQLDALYVQLNQDRSTLIAATSAGKSLIIYCLFRILQLLPEMHGKTFVLSVPNTLLVEQMYNDFENYSNNELKNWSVRKFCQKVTAKYPKYIDKQIVISTWHSLCKFPIESLNNIAVAIVDECHTCAADTLSNMLKSLEKCSIRCGLTGTLDIFEANQLLVQGLLGPKVKLVSAKELIDSNRATKVQINVIVLNHRDEDRKKLYDKATSLKSGSGRYNAELEHLQSDMKRRELLSKLFNSVDGNSLILFNRVEDYGKPFYQEFKEKNENTFLIIGEVSADEKENIRLSMEDYDNAKIFANYKCVGTGVSIKKLTNAFFISSVKSSVTVLQSIGRLMRLHESKDMGMVYDIVDNLTYNGRENFSYKHAQERIAMYEKEGHPITFLSIDL